jgi:hypothetical protein
MATRKERDDETEKKPRAEAQEKPDREPMKDEVLEIEVKDGEDEDDDDDSVEIEEPKPTRIEKKRARGQKYSEMQAELEATKAKAAQYEQERQAYFQQQQQLALHQQANQQGNQEIQALWGEQKRMYKAFEALRDSGRLTETEMKEWEDWTQDFERRKTAALMRANGVGQQQASPQQIAQMAEYSRIRNQYSDIYGHPQALAWGEGALRQRIALNGGQLTYELLDEVAQETRQRFGLSNGHRRHAPPPDAATRARFSAVPARSNGAGDGTVRVVIGRDQRRIAQARYPDLSEDDAVKKWARGPGRRAALAEKNSR